MITTTLVSRTVSTSIAIEASAEVVWRVLIDFANYGDWNPFIQRVDGPLVEGAHLGFLVATGPGTTVSTEATLLTVEHGRRLAWGGQSRVPGLFRGVHSFIIEERASGVLLHNTERFSGLLAFRVKPERLERQQGAFAHQDSALKARAESLVT